VEFSLSSLKVLLVGILKRSAEGSFCSEETNETRS
jgi:hypothetical protein